MGRFHEHAGPSGGLTDLFYAELEGYGEMETIEDITRIFPDTPREFEILSRDGQTTTTTAIAALHLCPRPPPAAGLTPVSAARSIASASSASRARADPAAHSAR